MKKWQLTDTSTEMTKMFELSNKDFKAAITNTKTIQQVIMNTTETSGSAKK